MEGEGLLHHHKWYVLYFLPFEIHILRYQIYQPQSLKSLSLSRHPFHRSCSHHLLDHGRSGSSNGHCPCIYVLIHATIICWIMKDRGSASVKKVSSNFLGSRPIIYASFCPPVLPTYCSQSLNNLWMYRKSLMSALSVLGPKAMIFRAPAPAAQHSLPNLSGILITTSSPFEEEMPLSRIHHRFIHYEFCCHFHFLSTLSTILASKSRLWKSYIITESLVTLVYNCKFL